MFSKEWEERYSRGMSHSLWPWTDLIKYVNRYGNLLAGDKVLELGPGIGANIPYFLSIGVDYYAIEGSPTAVKVIRDKYPELVGKIVNGDFTKSIPFDVKFNLVVDRSSLTHNSTTNIMDSLAFISDKLLPEGKFIGIDWFSWEHGQRREGIPNGDPYTFTFEQGKFIKCGKVHFSTEAHLFTTFWESGFEIEVLEHKVIQNVKPDEGSVEAMWNLVAMLV
jgi:SAM-dependent methyltransferase